MNSITPLRFCIAFFPPVIGFLAGQALGYGLMLDAYILLGCALALAWAGWHSQGNDSGP
jgi:hypothetical protein